MLFKNLAFTVFIVRFMNLFKCDYDDIAVLFAFSTDVCFHSFQSISNTILYNAMHLTKWNFIHVLTVNRYSVRREARSKWCNNQRLSAGAA